MSKKPSDDEDDLGPTPAQVAYDEHRRQIEAPLELPTADTPRGQGNKFAAKRSPERDNVVVAWLERGYTLGTAADKAGTSRNTLQAWRQSDPEFNRRVEEAMERGTDVIEDEARRRAVDGIDEPVFQQGECVGFKRVHSDSLMQMILGGRRAKYRKQQVEHSGPDGAPIPTQIEIAFVSTKEKKS